MNQNELELGRRNMHWLAYVKPAISHLAAFVVILYFISYATRSPSIKFLVNPAAISCVLILAHLLYEVLYKRSFIYIVTSQRVQTDFGLLPWQKRTTYLTLENIFEGYVKQSINEKMFNYGNVILIKKDGLRSEYILPFIPEPLGFLSLINQEKEFPASRTGQGSGFTQPGADTVAGAYGAGAYGSAVSAPAASTGTVHTAASVFSSIQAATVASANPAIAAEPATAAYTSPAQSSSGSFQLTDQLEKLIRLKNEGNITPEEFDRLKAKLLQGI